MTLNSIGDQLLMKKCEAVKMFGFGQTAGYKYLDWLVDNNLVTPVYMPGISRARFRKDELLNILSDSPPKMDMPKFVVHEKL